MTVTIAKKQIKARALPWTHQRRSLWKPFYKQDGMMLAMLRNGKDVIEPDRVIGTLRGKSRREFLLQTSHELREVTELTREDFFEYGLRDATGERGSL